METFKLLYSDFIKDSGLAGLNSRQTLIVLWWIIAIIGLTIDTETAPLAAVAAFFLNFIAATLAVIKYIVKPAKKSKQ